MKVNNPEYLGPVILERVDHIREDLSEIKAHLTKLNNQTFKNTEHRIKQSTTNRMVIGFISIFGVTILGMVIKII